MAAKKPKAPARRSTKTRGVRLAGLGTSRIEHLAKHGVDASDEEVEYLAKMALKIERGEHGGHCCEAAYNAAYARFLP